jgi:hypothetical protein
MRAITPAMQKTRMRRMLLRPAITALVFFASGALETHAHATNILLNGTFNLTSGAFGSAGGGLNTGSDYNTGGSLTNWTVSDVSGSSGLALLYVAGNQGSTTTNGDGVNLTGRYGNFSVFDPGNVAGTTPTAGAIPNASPGGGNFIAADGASGYNVAIYEAVSSLNAGSTYALTFWYAAGQQYNFSGTTTEGWQVSFQSAAQLTQTTANGTTIQDTPTQPGGGLANGSFQAWAQDTMYFTATSSSEVLTFLSMGTPGGQPPIDFLSTLSLSQTPEPASLSLSCLGVASLIAFAWFRKRQGSQTGLRVAPAYIES